MCRLRRRLERRTSFFTDFSPCTSKQIILPFPNYLLHKICIPFTACLNCINERSKDTKTQLVRVFTEVRCECYQVQEGRHQLRTSYFCNFSPCACKQVRHVHYSYIVVFVSKKLEKLRILCVICSRAGSTTLLRTNRRIKF